MSEIWSIKVVQSIQVEIKAVIAAEMERSGAEGTSAFMRGEIQRLGSSSDLEAPLRRLVYCISSLYHHRRHDCLKPSEVRSIYDLATAILRASGIKPAKSRVAFLFGDLHQVMTQIMLMEGRYWESALELARAHRFGEVSATDSEQQRSFAMGIRLERLGMLHDALATYDQIDASRLLPQNATNWLVRRLRLYRLLGRAQRHADLVNGYENSENQDIRREVLYEKTIADCIKTGEFRSLFNLVRKGGTHYQMGYILETRFWLASIKTREFLKELPTVLQLSRRIELNEQMDNLLIPISRLLDQVIDDDFSNNSRLDSMIAVLAKATTLPTFEQELLAMMTISRAASRRNFQDLSSLVANRYRFMCRAASNGQSDDLIGLLADLAPTAQSEELDPSQI
jgi:hypothetical protein